MIPANRTVLILLAAGRSRRFGDSDKLEQEFLHQPLAFHVVTALEDMPFLARFAITSGTKLDFARRGYTVIANESVEGDLSSSLRLGVAAARDLDADAVVIALADMPRVTAGHLYNLLDAADGPNAVVASSDGVQPRPPAVFGADQFSALLALEGDSGARDMVLGGKHVVAPANELLDVDTPEDLDYLRALVRPIRAVERRSD
ncbi:MAG: NTP transferase domain-containing protein [Pseudomonadota bacterium]|uniref:nucleotidyltransferase family protein n=1 Tax=Sphingomonas sp. ERG5 TaxID=1381597 RepID=UPI00054BF7D6|nr:NTP transferase domain-containing protein [Sphingomonas sp. ERG5]